MGGASSPSLILLSFGFLITTVYSSSESTVCGGATSSESKGVHFALVDISQKR